MKKQLLIWLLSMFFLKASGQYQDILNKTYAQRCGTLMQFYVWEIDRLDSAFIFRKIDTIESLADKHNDEDLKLETCLMKIHYYWFRQYFSREMVLAKIDSLQKIAIRKNIPWLMARTQSLLALTYFEHGYNYELAFVHFHKLYELIQKINARDFPDKQACYYQIGNAYYFFSDMPNTIKYLEEGIRETPAQKQYNFVLQCCNTLGLCYQELRMFDSSDYYFRLAYDTVAVNNPAKHIWDGISSGNIGYNYFLKKQYDKAKPLLQKDVDIAIETGDLGLAVGSLTPLGAIALEEHDIPKATTLLSQAKQFTEISGQYKRYEKLYPLLSKLAAAKGQGSLAAMYLDSAMFVKDSMARKFNALQMARAQQRVELEQHEAELSYINSEKRIKTTERNLLLLGIALLMIVAVYVYKQQLKKMHLKQLALAKTEEELANATEQLNNFTRKISENNSIIETLRLQLGDTGSEALLQLQQSTILTDNEWEAFRNMFEKVHTGYLQRLREKLPGLSPAETRFMTLSKLKLSNKEMASTLGVGTDAIRQYRSRLRKKLNLTEEGSLEELVEAI